MLKVFIIVVVLFRVGYAVVITTTTTTTKVEFGNAGWEDERRRAVRSEAEFGVPGAVVDHDRRAVVVVVIRAHFYNANWKHKGSSEKSITRIIKE